MDSNYYKYVPVYYEDKGYVYCYRVFQHLKTKKYYVQSKDNLSLGEKSSEYIEKQFLELFVESEPSKRIKGFKNLKKAIKTFNLGME